MDEWRIEADEYTEEKDILKFKEQTDKLGGASNDLIKTAEMNESKIKEQAKDITNEKAKDTADKARGE